MQRNCSNHMCERRRLPRKRIFMFTTFYSYKYAAPFYRRTPSNRKTGEVLNRASPMPSPSTPRSTLHGLHSPCASRPLRVFMRYRKSPRHSGGFRGFFNSEPKPRSDSELLRIRSNRFRNFGLFGLLLLGGYGLYMLVKPFQWPKQDPCELLEANTPKRPNPLLPKLIHQQVRIYIIIWY
jgi:hypothetical protein